MRYGKLTTDELKRYVLDKIHVTRKEVVLSAAEGEDCAALNISDTLLLSSDPITAPMPLESLGELSVHINCNDIAADGGEPIALMCTIIVPPDFEPEGIGVIMDSLIKAADSIGVDVVGGHTEYSSCVNIPITCTTAVGYCKRLTDKSQLRVGDKLVVTKTLGMEGMRIILESLGQTEIPEYKFYKDGLSVVPESRILTAMPEVGMLHDITEGGVLGAVAEVCGSLGARIDSTAFPIDVCTKTVCAKHRVDPARLLSSGSMLFSTRDEEKAIAALHKAGIAATVIGEVTDDGAVTLLPSGERITVERDALYDFTEKRS